MIVDWRHEARLLLLWSRREIKSRYAGSIGGLAWALLLPLATMFVFYLVFAVVLRVRIPELAGASGYFYYLLVGLLPWLAISESLTRCVGILVAQEQFLQKMVFPVAILPGAAIVAGLVPQIVGTIVLLLLLFGEGILRPAGIAWLPFILGCQLLMTSGAGLCLAVLGLHFRDLGQVVPILLQLLFYASPILYPKSLVPDEYHILFFLNPFSGLVEAYQAALVGLPIGQGALIALAGWTLLLGAGGVILFRWLKPTIGDYL